MLQFQTSGVVSDGKINILGAFRGQKYKNFPTIFKKIDYFICLLLKNESL